MVFCTSCGFNLGPSPGRFCGSCGAISGPPSTPASSTTSVASPRGGGGSSTTTFHPASSGSPRGGAHSTSNQYLPGRAGSGGDVGGEMSRAMGGGGTSSTTYYEPEYRAGAMDAPCKACRRGIAGENIVALGAIWHIACWKCQNCGEEFERTGNKKILERDGFPWCENCFAERFGAPCAGCGRGVGGHHIKALGLQYHPECFGCTACGSKLESGGVYNKGGRPHCRNCV